MSIFTILVISSCIGELFVPVEKPSLDDLAVAYRWRSWWHFSESPDGCISVRERPLGRINTGPHLPFLENEGELHAGNRHVLEVDGGYLVGVDNGEWGGVLDFFGMDGAHLATLCKDNVRGMVSSAGGIATMHGLDHLGTRRGSVRFWRNEHGVYVQDREQKLDACPMSFYAAGNDLWILTSAGLWLVSRTQAERLHSIETLGLDPLEMVVDKARDVWIGAKRYIIHLKSRGIGFEERWLVKRDQSLKDTAFLAASALLSGDEDGVKSYLCKDRRTNGTVKTDQEVIFGQWMKTAGEAVKTGGAREYRVVGVRILDVVGFGSDVRDSAGGILNEALVEIDVIGARGWEMPSLPLHFILTDQGWRMCGL